jgi:DNA-binding PadR family transcriptional regulator
MSMTDVEVKVQKKRFATSQVKDPYLIHLERYRFLTAEQLRRLLNHSPKSLPRVLALLRDLVADKLVVVTVRPTKKRTTENIYALRTQGRRYLEDDLGIEVKKSYEPEQFDALGSGHIDHVVGLNDFLISALDVTKVDSSWTVERWVHDFEMQGKEIRYEAKERVTLWKGAEKEIRERTKIEWINPDGLLVFKQTLATGGVRRYRYFVEHDTGTESESKMKQKINSYYYAITSGVLASYFELKHIDGILFSTTSNVGDRVALWQKHAKFVLEEIKAKQELADLFLFNKREVGIQTIDVKQTFFDPVWQFTNKDRKPVSLII